MYYIGIDGGGTKTKFTISNEENIIGSIVKSSCHYNEIGFSGIKDIFQDGVEELLKKYNVQRQKIVKACIGMTGYGEINDINNKITEALKAAFKEIPIEIFNDVRIAHAGALGGNDGIVIIAGTGSIGYSVHKGKTKRAGGWGYTIGDEGSAYWIGKKVIECFSKQADGRLKKGHLYSLLKDELKLNNDYDLIYHINKNIKESKGKTAAIAKVCYNAAKLGDENAQDIFNCAGEELAQIINILAKEFNGQLVNASYIGGVFNSENLIIKPIINKLDKNINFVKPKFGADIGACLLAKL